MDYMLRPLWVRIKGTVMKNLDEQEMIEIL